MKLRPVLIALLVLCSVGTAVALPPPGIPNGPLPDAPTNHHSTYAVEQGGSCTQVSPIHGSKNVVDFYDYESPYTNKSSWAYGSFGTKSVTHENGSTMFLYQAPSGVISLVMIHDRMNKSRTGGSLPISTVTFKFSGLPSSGKWVLMDDTYPHRDDKWSRNELDWMWAGSRTDGGVFRGLPGDSNITVTPSWNRDAALYNPSEAHENVTSWSFLTGSVSNPDSKQLDMDEPVSIHAGTCGESLNPVVGVSGTAGAGNPVSFDASQTSDSGGSPTKYHWDFDNDGTVDQTTTRPTTTHVYETPGNYIAHVTVEDNNGRHAGTTVPVTVKKTKSNIRVTGASLDKQQVSKGDTVTVTATLKNTGDGAGEIPTVLAVGDSVGDRKRVQVGAGATKKVTYSYEATSSGKQEVAVNGVKAGTLDVQTPTTQQKTTTQQTTTHSKPSGTTHGTTDDNTLPGPNIVFKHPGVSGLIAALVLLGAAIVIRR
ncbi:PKD domain-containing protein [Haladaptatus sp. R4]|uniref:PKD domain-containing protein n=1 Tax=Haladaptatus sp. R4 TaxID=1679489 RepID=UPI0007B4BD57|nr:PKD domain-containing protein [Haladaptatus sp. R4]KZN24627.1 PKD domain-containing protein [Haladaptatus sp. R4]